MSEHLSFVALSGDGEARRAEILARMQRTGRARRARRVGAMFAGPICVVAAAAAVVLALPGEVPEAPRETLVDRTPAPAPLPSPQPEPAEILRPQVQSQARVEYAVAETSPGIVEKYTAPKHAGRGVIYIGDGELSRELGAAGHDPGVIRTPTTVIIVAGPELARGGS